MDYSVGIVYELLISGICKSLSWNFCCENYITNFMRIYSDTNKILNFSFEILLFVIFWFCVCNISNVYVGFYNGNIFLLIYNNEILHAEYGNMLTFDHWLTLQKEFFLQSKKKYNSILHAHKIGLFPKQHTEWCLKSD